MRWIIYLVTNTLPAVFLIVSTWVLLPDEARAAQVGAVEQENSTILATPERTTIELPRGSAFYGAWNAPGNSVRDEILGGHVSKMTEDEVRARAKDAYEGIYVGILFMVIFGIAIPLSIAFALNVPIVAGPVAVALSITMFMVGIIMLIVGAAKLQKLKSDIEKDPFLSYRTNERNEPTGFLTNTQTYHGVELSAPRCFGFQF